MQYPPLLPLRPPGLGRSPPRPRPHGAARAPPVSPPRGAPTPGLRGPDCRAPLAGRGSGGSEIPSTNVHWAPWAGCWPPHVHVRYLPSLAGVGSGGGPGLEAGKRKPTGRRGLPKARLGRLHWDRDFFSGFPAGVLVSLLPPSRSIFLPSLFTTASPSASLTGGRINTPLFKISLMAHFFS